MRGALHAIREVIYPDNPLTLTAYNVYYVKLDIIADPVSVKSVTLQLCPFT